MTHSAHRYGTKDSLANDYTIYARTSRFVNRENCGPKLRKILEIFLSESFVNFGSSHAGNSYASGLQIEEYRKSLDNAYGVCCSFSSKASVKRVLQKLKEADLGISIVVSGLIDEVKSMAGEVGITPHTILLSLGIHGNTSLLPKEEVLEVITMCGHSVVAQRLTNRVMQQVKNGELSPGEGAEILAQPCPCGLFNLDRCREILQRA